MFISMRNEKSERTLKTTQPPYTKKLSILNKLVSPSFARSSEPLSIVEGDSESDSISGNNSSVKMNDTMSHMGGPPSLLYL